MDPDPRTPLVHDCGRILKPRTGVEAAFILAIYVIPAIAVFIRNRMRERRAAYQIPIDPLMCQCMTRRTMSGADAAAYARLHLASGSTFSPGIDTFSCPVTRSGWVRLHPQEPGTDGLLLVRLPPGMIEGIDARFRPGMYL